jgi:predicted MPP superfamily phosphohydrolase
MLQSPSGWLYYARIAYLGKKMKLDRRSFLKITSTALAGLVLAPTTFLAINNEYLNPVIDRVQIPIKGLHPDLDGFTIAQITDIHLYPYTTLELVQKSVELANSLNPGLTVLTGDFVWRDVEAIFDLAPALAKLNARHGVFWTIGNHDIWADIGIVKKGFQEVGLPLLENQGLSIGEGKGSFYLAGLDDGWSGAPDLEASLQGRKDGEPVVLLLHEPDLADLYSQDKRIVLQLAGHTHGGQVRLPRRGPFILPYLGRKYDFGLYKVNGMWLYTNRGLGCISVPMRYNCPPEVTEFTLVRA